MWRGATSWRVGAWMLLWSASGAAATGVCDQDANTLTACLSAVGNLPAGKVKNDVFRDAAGKTGDQLLPSQFGKLFQQFPGCNLSNTICNGFYDTDDKRGCPSVHCVDGWSRDFNETASYVNLLDWKYANPIRLKPGHGTSAVNPSCPSWDDGNSFVADGDTTGYVPSEGMVFDLGGPSNKVSIFAVNDHGPQPCESTEYVVYLSDNPFAKEVIDFPTTTGSDPQKWNRAVLQEVYLQGWTNVRNLATQLRPDCGDVDGQYTVEADSFVTVYALPCGITFRYAAIVVGNDGNDGWDGKPESPRPLSACAYHSFDGEIDAVAGLTEEGKAVCPDQDGDLFVDCSCPDAPPVCDCNDSDPSVHPGAPEACDSPDRNCDQQPGSCAAGLTCHQSTCLPSCSDKGDPCPVGSGCSDVGGMSLCVPTDCSVGGCPPGSTCDTTQNLCVPACEGVVCPVGQVCKSGACLDPCAQVKCPGNLICELGVCKPSCACFAGDIGCSGGLVCDHGSAGRCVAPPCVGVQCGVGQHCDPAAGTCVDDCQGVVCPKDSNPCTSDVCLGGACVHPPAPDSTSCADLDLCNGAESCQGGVCQPGTPLTCDDKNPCTADSCEPSLGCTTANLVDGKACSLGNACITAQCAAGVCTAKDDGSCDDQNPCTQDACDPVKGCQYTAVPNCGAGGSSGAAGASGAAGTTSGGGGGKSGSGGSGQGGASGAAGKSGGSSGGQAGQSGAAGKAGGAAGVSGSSGQSGSAGSAARGGAGGATSGGQAAASGDDGGCGCRAAGGGTTSGAWAALGLLAAAAGLGRRGARRRAG